MYIGVHLLVWRYPFLSFLPFYGVLKSTHMSTLFAVAPQSGRAAGAVPPMMPTVPGGPDPSSVLKPQSTLSAKLIKLQQVWP